jgi:penicillin amidase
MRQTLKAIVIGLIVLALGVGAYVYYLHRRALPVIDGTVLTPGVAQPVRIVRDRWGVPHVFAETEQDGYYGLGWATAQDRLFQIAMLNQGVRGRLAEWFGEPGLELDRVFRTLDFQGIGKRMYSRASPEARAAIDAYQRGVNDYAATISTSLPIEFAILRMGFRPLEPGDLVGVIGFMTWALHDAWRFEPLYEQLVAKVGEGRARELFPYAGGGRPAVHGSAAASQPELFRLSTRAQGLLALLPQVPASNNWAISPARSASGHAMLANDPHLGHAQPGVWYEAHLRAGALDVAGVLIPGLPFIVLGHNRDIAWGFTNLMVDAGDFFIERINPDDPGQVMHRGQWVPLQVRGERIQVRGGDTEELQVRITPHGPIVNPVMKQGEKAESGEGGQAEEAQLVLSYRWLYWVVDGDVDAIFQLNRARNWAEFREAARHFGAITQNVAYADREGHIAMQTIGKIPLRGGDPNGTRYRVGWDGSQEWEEFVPFDALPMTLDPPHGWVASANNPVLSGSAPFYLSAHYEPLDRIMRIHERLGAPGKLSLDDMRAIQADTVWTSALRLRPRVLAAYAGLPEPSGTLRVALEALRGFDGDMRAESAAAAVMAVFYEHLYREVFSDELGEELLRDLRAFQNVAASMLWAVFEEGRDAWLDRTDTPEREEAAAIIRDALGKALQELERRLGSDPARWQWGRLHTLEFVHPLGRVKLLAPYFNVGPFPVPGHANTVNKMQFRPEDYGVYHGPSMRQITDFADLNGSLAVLPTGQSGLRASPHYDDLAPLWLGGGYHPSLMDEDQVEAAAEARLTLRPQ